MENRKKAGCFLSLTDKTQELIPNLSEDAELSDFDFSL